MNESPRKPQERKLLDQTRDVIRLKHYSIRTEEAYIGWIRRFILFHDKRHPKDMGGPEIEAFLTHLAVEGHVAASTQNQALSALLFLYRDVLKKELDYPIAAVRAKESKHLPAVLTKDETRRVIARLSGIHQLLAKLLYGSGLRLLECLRLRVKDLDFARRAMIVRDTKGDEDRVTMLPDSLIEPLKEHLQRVKRLHEEDLAKGYGAVYLPDALDRKYPNAAREWIWQYVFPSDRLSVDPRSGIVRRHHADESGLQKAVRQAAKTADLTKHVSPHTFRQCAASFRTPSPPTCWRTTTIPSTCVLGRCPHRPGTSRPQRCQNHHDLHARPPARGPGRPQPARLIIYHQMLFPDR